MRMIGTLPTVDDADLFVDVLFANQISAKSEPLASGFEIWVMNEDQLEPSKALFGAFQQNPARPDFQAARETASAKRRSLAVSRKATRNLQMDTRKILSGQAASGAFPITTGFIVLSVVVSYFVEFGQTQTDLMDRLMISSDGSAREILSGEVWRLFTPMFIHLGPMHLLFNMMLFWQLGRMLELAFGSGRFLALTLVVEVGSSLLQWHYQHHAFGGMSGVGYGLFGFAWLYYRTNPWGAVYVSRDLVFQMLIWAVICTTGAFGPIANYAHFGGLGIGMFLGYVSAKASRK